VLTVLDLQFCDGLFLFGGVRPKYCCRTSSTKFGTFHSFVIRLI